MTKLVRLLIGVLLVVGLASCGDDGDDDAARSQPTPTTTAEPEPTATPASTPTPAATADPTSEPTPTQAPANAFARPWHEEPVTHDDPASAAQEFADYFRFGDPTAPFELSEFMAGDSRSGEIELRNPFGDEFFHPTLLFLRLDDNDHWVVTGAVSGGMEVHAPLPDATVSSPFEVVVTNIDVMSSFSAELWPLGADAPRADGLQRISGGVYAVGDTNDLSLRWTEEAPGPATLVIRSVWYRAEDLASGVTAFQIDLE